MTSILLTSIFGIIITIIGTIWTLLEFITYFEKTMQGMFLFGIGAGIILFLSRMLLLNFARNTQV